jgi:hypothetical protein
MSMLSTSLRSYCFSYCNTYSTLNLVSQLIVKETFYSVLCGNIYIRILHCLMMAFLKSLNMLQFNIQHNKKNMVVTDHSYSLFYFILTLQRVIPCRVINHSKSYCTYHLYLFLYLHT